MRKKLDKKQKYFSNLIKFPFWLSDCQHYWAVEHKRLWHLVRAGKKPQVPPVVHEWTRTVTIMAHRKLSHTHAAAAAGI